MNNLIKNSLLLTILFTTSTITPINIGITTDKMWKNLNTFSGIGSAASFAFWIKTTLDNSQFQVLMPAGNGSSAVTVNIHSCVSRLILDAACIAASIDNNCKTEKDVALNTACLLGSVYSLLLWMPAIKSNGTNPLYIARGAIDAAQIIINAKRLHDWWNNNVTINLSH